MIVKTAFQRSTVLDAFLAQPSLLPSIPIQKGGYTPHVIRFPREGIHLSGTSSCSRSAQRLSLAQEDNMRHFAMGPGHRRRPMAAQFALVLVGGKAQNVDLEIGLKDSPRSAL